MPNQKIVRGIQAMGNGSNHFENWPRQPFHHHKPAHQQAERDAEDEGQNVAGKGFLDACPGMPCQNRAVGVGLGELHHKELINLRG